MTLFYGVCKTTCCYVDPHGSGLRQIWPLLVAPCLTVGVSGSGFNDPQTDAGLCFCDRRIKIK